MDNENNLPTRRYTEVAVRLKPSMSGFRTIEAGEAEAVRQSGVALKRTGQFPSIGGPVSSGVSRPSSGSTGTFNKVGGKTGTHGRVGGRTGTHARVGGRTGQHARVGSQTAMQTRVGGNTGAFGVVTGSQSPVRRAVERQKRSTAVDPMVGVMIGVGLFFAAILFYGLSRPATNTVAQQEPAALSQEEQNRLARAINVERAKQAKLMYADLDAKEAKASQPVDRGLDLVKNAPARKPEATREAIQESKPRLATGGVITGVGADQQESLVRPMAPRETALKNEAEIVAAIPPKPDMPSRLATGGVVSGMSADLAARNTVAAAPVEAKPAAPAAPAPKVQRSKKDAPHGGVMYEVGPGVALLEFQLDRTTGQLALYIMDPVTMKSILMRQPTMDLEVPQYQQVFTLRAQRSASAQFAGQYDLLRGNHEAIRVLIPSLTVNGKEVKDIGVEF